MRRLYLGILLFVPTLTLAKGWSLDLGLSARMGVSDFAGAASPAPPPTDPTNLFAIFPPTNVASQQAQLSGGGGLQASLAWKRRLGLELGLIGAQRSVLLREDITFPTGLNIKRGTEWRVSALELPVQVWLGYPFQARGITWVPRVGGGLWYTRITSAQRFIGAEGLGANEFAWRDSPPDDWGWSASAGLDWILRLGKDKRSFRFGLDLRVAQGQRAIDNANGGDKAFKMIEGALSLPFGSSWEW